MQGARAAGIRNVRPATYSKRAQAGCWTSCGGTKVTVIFLCMSRLFRWSVYSVCVEVSITTTTRSRLHVPKFISCRGGHVAVSRKQHDSHSQRRHFLHALDIDLSTVSETATWPDVRYCAMVLVKDATIDAAMWAGVVVAAGSSLPPTARSECGDVVRSCDEVIRTLRGYEGCTWEDAEVWVVVDDIVRGIMEDAAMWARAAVAAGLSLNASAGECDDVIRICDDVMRTLHGIQSCACDDAKVWAEVTSAAGLNLQIYAAPRLVIDATMSAPTVMEHRRDEPDIDELSSKDITGECTNASPPSPEPQPTNLASQVTSDMSRPGQRSHLRSLRLLARLPRVSRLVDSPHVPHRRIAPTAERFCRPSAAWLDNYRETVREMVSERV